MRSGFAACSVALVLLGTTTPSQVRAELPASSAATSEAEGPPATPGPGLHPRLTVDLWTHGTVTGGMLLLSLTSQLMANRLAAPACRWCEPNKLDRWARRELIWTQPKTAEILSDVLAYGLPIGAALTLGLTAGAEGAKSREIMEDLLVVGEGMAAGTLVTQVSKFATGRLRPDGWASGGRTTADSRMSFWGGHAMLAFSVAAGATQVARLRGRPGWKWLAVASFAGAATTAWLRVGADRHWLTDVVVGAGVGSAVGFGVPLLVLRPAGERPAVTLVPAPGGLALVF